MATPPFPFIVACGRSGTTLLQAMLSAHPDMAVPPEAPFIVPLSRRVRHTDGRPDATHLAALLAGNRLFALWDVPEGEVAAAVKAARPATYPDAVRVLYGLYARRQGKRRYGDKTPGNVRHMEYLAEAFPEARFIHMIRDGRDVTCSFLAHRLGPRNATEGAIRWTRMVEMGRRVGRRLGSGRYLEVRYEEMVADPPGRLRAICGFIELPFDERMLDYHRDAERHLPTGRLRSLHPNLSRPPSAGLRDWRREMEPSQVAEFEALGGGLLEELGYDRALPRVPLPARVRAGRDWLSYQAARAAGKARRLAGLRGGRGTESPRA